jgi:hypothetical protein
MNYFSNNLIVYLTCPTGKELLPLFKAFFVRIFLSITWGVGGGGGGGGGGGKTLFFESTRGTSY